LDLISDLGGVTELLISIVGCFVFPITKHSFIMRYLLLIFIGKTTDESFFKKAKMKNKKNKNKLKSLKISTPNELKGTQIAQEIKNHHPIKLSIWQHLKLFSIKFFYLNSCFSLSKNSKRLRTLYRVGADRIESDLSIERIVKNLRDIKIMLKNSVKDPSTKFKVQHDLKNCIDVDLDEDELKRRKDKFDQDNESLGNERENNI
jgi:hypothetical protein